MSGLRILVTGASGQLGRSLADIKETLPAEWVFTQRGELDISDPTGVQQYFAAHRFDYCFNTAAYTRVDGAETDRDAARMINETAPGIVGACCAQQGCALIHFSTDYVYDNGLTRPLKEDDPCTPASVYAHSKLAGERLALAANGKTLMIRTSWVFSEYGHNFVRTMARLLMESRSVRVVNDQVGCPTYAGDLAKALVHIIQRFEAGDPKAVFGLYNFCNSGAVTWYDFALEIGRQLGIGARISPVSTEEYGALAARPPYSVLDTSKIESAFDLQIQPWEKGLTQVLSRMQTSA